MDGLERPAAAAASPPAGKYQVPPNKKLLLQQLTAAEADQADVHTICPLVPVCGWLIFCPTSLTVGQRSLNCCES
jgi:hypothetical protein